MLTNQGWAYFVLALLLVTFLFALYCILYDCGLMSFSMRVAHVREKASVLLHDDIFHLDASEPALVQWCEGASLDELALLRDVEKMLRNVKAQHHDFGSAANRRNQGTNQDTRLALFCAQIEHTTPLLLNWLSDDTSTNGWLFTVSGALNKYVGATVIAHRADRAYNEMGAPKRFPATNVISSVARPAIARWLSEEATRDQKDSLCTLLECIDKSQQERVTRREETRAKSRIRSFRRSGVAEDKSPKVSMWQRARETTNQDHNALDHMLRDAAIVERLEELARNVNCHHVVLVPVTTPHGFEKLPPLVVTNKDLYRKQATVDRVEAAVRKRTDWAPEDTAVPTPTGMCLASATPVLVDCYTLDERFREASKQSGLHSMSQLCVPVSAASQSEDADRSSVRQGELPNRRRSLITVPTAAKDVVKAHPRSFVRVQLLQAGKALVKARLSLVGARNVEAPLDRGAEPTTSKPPVAIGILKCINKITFAGHRTGVPFDRNHDMKEAVAAASKIFEIAQSFVAKRRAARILTKFQKERRKHFKAEHRAAAENVSSMDTIDAVETSNGCSADEQVVDAGGALPAPHELLSEPV